MSDAEANGWFYSGFQGGLRLLPPEPKSQRLRRKSAPPPRGIFIPGERRGNSRACACSATSRSTSANSRTCATARSPSHDTLTLPADSSTQTDIADAAGAFTFEVEMAASGRLEALREHTTGDPALTTRGALEALRMAVGLNPSWGPAEALDFVAADFNGDGRVTTGDALEILRLAVGLTAGSAPRWVFVDQEADLSGLSRSNTQPDFGIAFDQPTSDLGDLGMVGILIGDVRAYV